MVHKNIHVYPRVGSGVAHLAEQFWGLNEKVLVCVLTNIYHKWENWTRVLLILKSETFDNSEIFSSLYSQVFDDLKRRRIMRKTLKLLVFSLIIA